MITMGFTGDGLTPLRASPEADANARTTGENGADLPFGELLSSAVELDAQTANALLLHPVVLTEAQAAAMPGGTALPVGGKALPQLQAFLPNPLGQAAVAGTDDLDVDALGRLEYMMKSIGERAGRAPAAGQSAPEQLTLPLTQASVANRSAPAPAAMPSAPLTPGQPGFEQALGQRLVMMVQQGVQHARVSIHPEHLGPMDIRMRIDSEGAHLLLQSPHAPVREVLEQALPRLRDMLAEGGLELVDVDVGDNGQETGERAADAPTSRAAGDRSAEAADDELPRVGLALRGLLDTFA